MRTKVQGRVELLLQDDEVTNVMVRWYLINITAYTEQKYVYCATSTTLCAEILMACSRTLCYDGLGMRLIGYVRFEEHRLSAPATGQCLQASAESIKF